jgi:hypothetical protein
MSYHRSNYSHEWLKRKYLLAERRGRAPIRATGLRFKTKKQAEREADRLNRQLKGTDTEVLVRKVGWRRKIGYS